MPKFTGYHSCIRGPRVDCSATKGNEKRQRNAKLGGKEKGNDKDGRENIGNEKSVWKKFPFRAKL
jgi:hypothetical protein